jgi:hypothetical protein
VAGLDLALLATGSIGIVAARILRRRELGSNREPASASDASLDMPEAGNA